MGATFVLTPGRCGTQWLCRQLQPASGARARVCHEPLHWDYDPLHNSPANPLNKNAAGLTDHLRQIRRQLRQGPYLECGFPCWRHLDWFRSALGEVKVIHIHRDPVANASSLLKLNAFVPPLLPHLGEKQLFYPRAPGALLPEYADGWEYLSPFEKCLYYWAEVNLQAAVYRTTFPQHHWLTIPYSQLFDPMSLRRIADFAGLEWNFHPAMLARVDEFRGLPQSTPDPRLIHRHTRIVRAAADLGYDYSARTDCRGI